MPSPLRVFVDMPLSLDMKVPLESSEMHHMKRVMRASDDTEIEIVNGKGDLAKAYFKDCVIFSLEHHFPPTDERWLIQGLLEPSNLELVVEKGTELGITHFCFFPAEKSKLRTYSPQKLDRLKKIIISALKQCERLYLPSVKIFSKKEEICFPKNLYLADPKGGKIDTFRAGPRGIIVGPESGFTREELSFFQKKEPIEINLSPNILRAETAAIVGSFYIV